jgi:hypothetical protein
VKRDNFQKEGYNVPKPKTKSLDWNVDMEDTNVSQAERANRVKAKARRMETEARR